MLATLPPEYAVEPYLNYTSSSGIPILRKFLEPWGETMDIIFVAQPRNEDQEEHPRLILWITSKNTKTSLLSSPLEKGLDGHY